MYSPFDLISLLLVLAALFGYLNHRLLRLPLTVGLLILALLATLVLIGVDAAFPALRVKAALAELLSHVDFPVTLLNGLLSFLLFAGALEVDFGDLFARRWTILTLATFGTVLSTVLIGAALYFVSEGFGMAIPGIWCLVFGALISPTDPVAVLLVLRRVGIPRRLQATVAGESLFNDGIGVVIFTLVLSLAGGAGVSAARPLAIATLFVKQALGGGVLGLALGYAGYLLLRRIDDTHVELLISLALASGTYSLAGTLGLSGPIAVVVAGILLGNNMERATSELTRQNLKTFWLFIDDILNALLFLLIGLEIAAVELNKSSLLAMAAMIPIVLLARALSVAVSALPLSRRLPGRFGSLAVLTWGGLRGGISVALALSLPPTLYKDPILTISYGVVVFSIIVQGLSLERVARVASPRLKAVSEAEEG
jgi:Na+:H+ antiporter